jgi:Flp pilus assembly protein TadG
MAVTGRAARWQSERGAELIEFAIVVPLLILMLAAIMDFGMLFRSYEVVTNAAREGARVGVLPGYANADVTSRVDQYMVAAGLTGTYTVNVANVSVTTTANTFAAKSVTVNYTYQPFILAPVSALFGGSFGAVPLIAGSVMRTEAQAGP